ncbi:hypothetical protein SAMN04487988_10549 [Algoriphagus hitonicola]|uniref:Uncharacterized protein n=1 Tax=Algoriphagus hitonicola TaxID=435880 RepID=A0A1I2SSY5_9BACT|nr:hypothetical protein SAMN04487988_10549 [Algoriphagus hitonicola]
MNGPKQPFIVTLSFKNITFWVIIAVIKLFEQFPFVPSNQYF